MEEVGNCDNGSGCVSGGESYEILAENAFIVEVKWGRRTSTVAMHAVSRSNSLVDYKNTKEKNIRNTIIRAKEPTAIAFSRQMQTLISTRRKPMLANLGLLAQGAKLLISSRGVVKGLKVQIQAPLYWDLYDLNSSRVLFTCHNFENQETAHPSELASYGLEVPRLNRSDRMQHYLAHDHINPLKGARVCSSIITTVSPTYSPEVRTLLVGCIARLVPQKGLYLIRHAIYRMESGRKLVLLGSSPVALIQVKWRRTNSVAMLAATHSNFLRDWKTTKKQSIRSIVIHAKRPNAIVYSKLTLTLNCTRKATKTNSEILAQGAKLSTSNRVVLMVLKMRIQVAGHIWAADTVGEEFLLTFGVTRWSISTAFTHVAAKLGLQVLPAEPQPLVIIHCHDWRTAFIAPELYWDLYAPKGLNSARNFFTCLNFEYQGTARSLELASCGLDVPRLSIPDRMHDHSAYDRINPVKAAFVYSNIVTAVSPAYAQEVRTSQVSGITRLVPHKGLHLIRHAIYRMLELGGQLVLLGSSPMPHIQGVPV